MMLIITDGNYNCFVWQFPEAMIIRRKMLYLLFVKYKTLEYEIIHFSTLFDKHFSSSFWSEPGGGKFAGTSVGERKAAHAGI
jgi:hypothetical protein